MIKTKLAIAFVCLHITASYAQNNVGIGTTSPDPSAILDMQTTDKGVLVPRMTTVERIAIASPANALLVYDTDVDCFFYYVNSSGWQNLCTGIQGPEGPVGPQGPAGADGADGAQGPVGPQGPAGADGADGAQGPAGPEGPQGPAGSGATIISDNFNANGTLSIVTDSPSTITSTNAAWLCSATTGATNATTGTRYLGTSTNQHMDLVSNNLVRGRLSNLGEFFIGTTNTVLAGDLMNGVSNAGFPWAINGYSSFNGSGVYGSITSGTTLYAGVQGEYFGTNGSGAGVRGIADAGNTLGVHGQNAGVTTGWSGLFEGDLGYTGFFGVASDARLKKNIQTIPNALEIILKLRGTSYEHNLSTYPDLGLKTGLNYGFIAQEVEMVLPDLVKEKNLPHAESCKRDSEASLAAEQMKTVSYIEIVPILVEAIKDQQKQIDLLNQEIEQLKQH